MFLVVHDPCTYQFTKTSPSTSQVSGLRDCVTCDVAHPLLSETTHFNLASLHVYFRVGTTIIVPTWNLGSCSTTIPDSSFTKMSICLNSACLPCFVHLIPIRLFALLRPSVQIWLFALLRWGYESPSLPSWLTTTLAWRTCRSYPLDGQMLTVPQ